jgi:3-deoxy-manno-octulosonate cytidylyltransferase (CMP-KDO synthetase)
VRGFGGECIMTRSDHPNGTSRIAEAAESIDAPILVNVQGDEPEMDPSLIDLAVETLVKHPECPMATVAAPFGAGEPADDPNVVKVVLDRRGRAMYFSRALIPFDRDGTRAPESQPLKHVGLYVYRREFLAQYAALPPTPLEQTEQLEQLRALEHGFAIAVAIAPAPTQSHGIDTPEQYEAFVKRYRQSQTNVDPAPPFVVPAQAGTPRESPTRRAPTGFPPARE